MKKKNIIQLLGPTGVGKTKVSIFIAKEFNCEIISADSMQVYKDFNIGTDKITLDNMGDIRHHLIDIISDCSQFNASKFLELSYEISEHIINNNEMPLICGGTPFYHGVIKNGIFPEKSNTKKTRNELIAKIEKEGSELYWNKLNEIDSKYAKKINKNDKIRIVRGLEIFLTNNITPTEMFKLTSTPFHNYNFIRIGLNISREKLYEKIEKRIDSMLENGLIDEIKLLKNKYQKNCPPFGSLGYKEILMFLNGEIELSKAISLAKQHSRNYAKRQLSWFRREKDIIWFAPKDINIILKYINSKLII